MPFVTDTFTDTDGVVLTSHTGELGATWAVHAANDASLPPIISSNQLARNSAVNHILYASGSPAGADYTASLAWVCGGGATILGPGARLSTSASTGYFAFFFSAGLNIYKYVAGSLSSVASISWAPASGQSYVITLDVSGTALKSRVQRVGDSQWLKPDGTYQAGQIDAISTTDSSITAAGKAGLWMAGGTAERIDNFSADDPPVADTTAPTITGPSAATGSTSSVSVAENTTAVHTFTASESVTWSLNGGADVARFSINSSTGALAFLAAPNFEAPTDADTNNNYVVGVRATDAATNATTQTVTVTVTGVNEAPTYSGTITVPTLTQSAAMTPVATASLFGDPDAGDTAAYSAIGSWPAGVVVNSSTGVISGTPATAGSYTGLQVRRTDSGALTATSTAFAITVAAAGGVTFAGTVPSKSGTAAVAFAWGTPSLDSYFSGLGTYAVQSGSLTALGLSMNGATGVISGAAPIAGTQNIVIRKTATSGSPATADTNSFSITIAAASPSPPPPSGALPIMLGVTLDGALVILN